MRFAEVKVGDVVAVRLSGRTTKQTVSRVTATQFVTDDGKRFSRRHGWSLGDEYPARADAWDEERHPVIMQKDAESQARRDAEEAEGKLRRQLDKEIERALRNVPTTDQLRRIAAILAEPKP